MTQPPTIPAVPIDAYTARQLVQAAAKLDKAREVRDLLIVQAIRDGASYREVAALVGLSHPTVMGIVKDAR